MQIHTRNTPSFKDLEVWQQHALHDPLVDVIKEFYKSETNRKSFNEWLAAGKPMSEKQGVKHEQMRMAI